MNDIESVMTDAQQQKYNERDQLFEYVRDAAERGYPVEVSKWEQRSLIGIEVVLNDDRLGHFGTLQDIARGAVDEWFLRDLEPIGDNQVRIEFAIDAT